MLVQLQTAFSQILRNEYHCDELHNIIIHQLFNVSYIQSILYTLHPICHSFLLHMLITSNQNQPNTLAVINSPHQHISLILCTIFSMVTFRADLRVKVTSVFLHMESSTCSSLDYSSQFSGLIQMIQMTMHFSPPQLYRFFLSRSVFNSVSFKHKHLPLIPE